MRSGEQDRRIELRHRVLAAADANGQQVATWDTVYATRWAKKEEISAREYLAAETKHAENTVRFRIRYLAGVVATDRLTCEGKDYELTAPPSEFGRREELLIFARVVES